jgi:membrane protease YdiL (CAAX protease family)
LLQWISLAIISLLHFNSADQAAVLTLQGAQSWDTRAYLIAFTVLVAPVAEEVIFRGIIYPTIKQSGHPKIALWLTSFLFALIHGNVPIFLPLLVLALALTFLYEVTDNLLASITAHAVFNGINVVQLYFGEDLSQLWGRWYQYLLHHH